MFRGFLVTTTAATALAVACVFTLPVQHAYASPTNICSNTTISLTDNTTHTGLDGSLVPPATIADGDQVGIGGEADESTSAGSGCVGSGGSTAQITAGAIEVDEWTNATNLGCTGTIDDLGKFNPPTGVSETFDTTGLSPNYISFQNHYTPEGGTNFKESKSPCLTLQVQTASCTSLNTVTITPALATGPNPVNPNSGPWTWTYTFKVQNCTSLPTLSIKVQGGNAGWLTNTLTSASSDVGGACALSLKNRNAVETCDMTLGPNAVGTVTVSVTGTTPRSPDDNLSLSGIWSAVWSAGRTDAANNVTICSDTPTNCGI